MSIYFIYAFVVFLLFHVQPTKHSVLNQPDRDIRDMKKWSLIISIIILVLIVGLRDVSVGVDTKQYKVRFLLSAYNGGLDISQEEYGFPYIGYLFHKAGLSWQVYLFSLSAFMIGVLGLFIYRYSSTMWLSIWNFMFIGLFSMYMTGLRQSLAISICLLALLLLLSEKMRWIKYPIFLLLVFVATTIHTSAFAFYIMIIFSNVRLRRIEVFLLFLFSVSVLLYADRIVTLVEHILPTRYEDYELLGMNGEKYKQNPLVVIVTVLQTFFCLCFNKNINDRDGKYTKITSVLFLMSCLDIVFSMLRMSNNQIGRMAFYFSNANLVLVPQSIACIKDIKTRKFAIMSIALCALAYFLISTPGGTTEIDRFLFFWETQ